MDRDAGFSGGNRWAASDDDRAMRALAARLMADGWTRLRPDAAAARKIGKALALARRSGCDGAVDEAALRLCRDGSRAQACDWPWDTV